MNDLLGQRRPTPPTRGQRATSRGDTDRRLRAYRQLSGRLFAKTYLGKLLTIVFIGIHLPLLSMLGFFLFNSRLEWRSVLTIFIVMLMLTAIAAVVTLYALSVMLTPILLASRSLRLYRLDRRVPRLPTDMEDDAGQLLRDLQETVTHADEVERLLTDLSSRDHLTGLLNRRAGEERLRADVARAGRGGSPLTLAVLDSDGLKAINDRFGHEAGDACLKSLTGVLRQQLRETDWVARWGGDEFVVGFWNMQAGAATAALDRVRTTLMETPLTHAASGEMCGGFSAGIAEYQAGEDARTLYTRADAALYRAKRTQRGTIDHA